MATLQADDIADLIKGTLRDLGELKWTDIVSSLQEHVGLTQILKKEKVGFHSGYGIQFNVAVNPTNSARMVGLFEVDQVNYTDQMVQANLPWRHCITDWTIERRMIAMNREPRRIFELIKLNRNGAMLSLAELLENQIWNQPSSSSNNLDLFGIPYWIVPNTTTGFNGGNPYGFSAGCAGLSSTTYPNWSNWTGQYVEISKTDLVRSLRKAATFTKFTSPPGVVNASYNTGDRYGYYTTYAVISKMEELLEQQNDNLGSDIAAKDGDVMFRKRPITWVPKLETLTGTSPFSNATYASSGGYPTNPIFGINWGTLRPIFMEGEYLREEGPEKAPSQHNVLQTFVDCTLNLECRDRRRNFVLTQ